MQLLRWVIVAYSEGHYNYFLQETVIPESSSKCTINQFKRSTTELNTNIITFQLATSIPVIELSCSDGRPLAFKLFKLQVNSINLQIFLSNVFKLQPEYDYLLFKWGQTNLIILYKVDKSNTVSRDNL